MNNEKVTIIVGIYNSARFLRKGLESIFNQTYTNFEVLMMDDGSIDESGMICDEYAQKDNRFIAIHKTNSGVCDSRNKGLEMATGDYVCFMDGDDWLSEDFLEYMMDLITKTGTHMAFSDKVFTTIDREQSKDYDTVDVLDSETVITKIIYPYMALGPWNKIYSMEIIKKNKIRFPKRWFAETLHFAPVVAYYSGKVAVGHKKVYNYRLNNCDSGTTSYSVEARLSSLINVKALRNCCFANTEKINNAISWHLYDNYFILIMNIIATDSRKKHNKEYKEALHYMRKNWLNVFLKSELKIKERILVVVKAFFPVMLSKHRINRHKRKLSKW